MNKQFQKKIKWLFKNKFLVTVSILFIFFAFLRFYQIEQKNPFGYDQVDNAWAAKDIIVNHKYPLVGMVAKANSGIYIGPLYYYLASFFYFITNLHPIASGLLAGFTAVFTYWVIFYIFKNLFSKEMTLIALIIYAFNSQIIIFDRIQWPVNFIPVLGLIVFYLLYKIILGDVKKLIHLAIAIGFAFHIHFTAIFFPIIVFLSLPFFPRNKKTLKFVLISIPIFILFLIPNIIYSLQNKSYNSNLQYYLSSYFHGFHLTRLLQLKGDAVIQFDPYILFEKLKPLKFVLIPIFVLVYLKNKITLKEIKFIYLVLLWYLVPWVIFTTYSGELSDYYFALNRLISLIIVSYLIYRLWNIKLPAVKGLVAVALLAYCVYNFSLFLPHKDVGLSKRETEVFHAIEQKRRIEFQIGVPESYLYYYFMRQKKGVEVY